MVFFLDFQNSLFCSRNLTAIEISKENKKFEVLRKTGIKKGLKNFYGNGTLAAAFHIFYNESSIHSSTVGSSISSYGSLLQACSKNSFLEGGQQLHAHIIKTGFELDQFLVGNLLNMYIRCESSDLARKMFDRITQKNLVVWNLMLSGYCEIGFLEEALFLFLDLQRAGFEPDQFTLSPIIKGVSCENSVVLGEQFHCFSIKTGYGDDEHVGNALIQMYAICGRIEDSARLFAAISEKRPAIWNSMIARFTENGLHERSLMLYKQMQESGVYPTFFTFSSLLRSCAGLELISEGQQVHAQIIVRGLSSNLILGSALTNLYLKCRKLEQGRQLFDKIPDRTIITWNSMIRGYSQNGKGEEAMKLFGVMRKTGFMPDKFTFPALLIGGSISPPISENCRGLHSLIIKIGLESDQFVGSSLISTYSTSRRLEDTRLIFDCVRSKDLGLWSSIITANVHNREVGEALRLFSEMLDSDIKPNQFIYSSLFLGCADLSIVEIGKQIHTHAIKSGDTLDAATKNSLLKMYSNCGFIDKAWLIFESIENPTVISYNSMISAFAQHGFCTESLELFKEMETKGLGPDEITVLAILTACSHVGHVEKGLEIFYSMRIEPSYQHCACIVDMLARAGLIEEAERFLQAMPFEPRSSLWRVILGACYKYKKFDVGRRIGEFLLELEPNESVNYVLLTNVHAKSRNWVKAERVRNLMEERGIKKDSSFSWIEIRNKVHCFAVEDHSHPRSREIYEMLEDLIKEIMKAGYVPDTSFVLHEMENEKKREEMLFYHSEKLAFSFGLLSTTQGVPIRVMKNLRICGDCHSAFKYFSLVTRREIILKDNYRFHHFRQGLCSCNDYW